MSYIKKQSTSFSLNKFYSRGRGYEWKSSDSALQYFFKGLITKTENFGDKKKFYHGG